MLDALAITFIQYWQQSPRPDAADLDKHIEVIKEHLCTDQTLAYGTVIDAMLDYDKLVAQSSAFMEAAIEAADMMGPFQSSDTDSDHEASDQDSDLDEDEMPLQLLARHVQKLAKQNGRTQAAEAAAHGVVMLAPTEGLHRNTQFWRELTRIKSQMAGISEFVKLGEIAMVLVPGSVEDERVFLAMGYIKNKLRNRLGAGGANTHLADCVRVFCQDRYTISTFPYDRATQLWKDAATGRGRYVLGV